MSKDNSKESYKRSGAKFSKITEGKSSGMYCVNAWYSTKIGMVRIKAFGTEEVRGKTCTFHKAIAEVSNKSVGSCFTYPVLINVSNMNMPIEKLGILVTANGSGRTKSGKLVKGAVVSLNGQKKGGK